ncbi:PqqD family protein [Streptomyces sp. NPDC046985]|uniref:PqqD family protein n=1 Tax=Streptomyces sp. NPDC046985 TaxID=3155377 RepID=UPI00340B9744
MSTVDDNTVLVRRMDVTARRTEQVTELSQYAEGGVLLETVIGRYVLDRDARRIWLLIDGRRTVAQLVEDVAAKAGEPADEVRQPVLDLCGQLLEHGLAEIATAADVEAVAQMAAAG